MKTRIGAVSYLNTRPLVAALQERTNLDFRFEVPGALEALLRGGDVDVALIPIIDVLRGGGRYRVLSDAGIACDGETMTVRVFSQIPPDRVRRLAADVDSHTSVALAAVLWRELFGVDLEITPFDAASGITDAQDSVLLIGDKVIDPRRGSYAFEIDLGGAWRQHTGLPFVFAVWAAPAARPVAGGLAALLEEGRDRGVERAAEIATAEGPMRGWPVSLALRYLTRCLTFRLDERYVRGAERFARLCAEAGLAPPDAEIDWPLRLRPPQPA